MNTTTLIIIYIYGITTGQMVKKIESFKLNSWLELLINISLIIVGYFLLRWAYSDKIEKRFKYE